jgi:hypothetical protein
MEPGSRKKLGVGREESGGGRKDKLYQRREGWRCLSP